MDVIVVSAIAARIVHDGKMGVGKIGFIFDQIFAEFKVEIVPTEIRGDVVNRDERATSRVRCKFPRFTVLS